jgi:hypothetical protein
MQVISGEILRSVGRKTAKVESAASYKVTAQVPDAGELQIEWTMQYLACVAFIAPQDPVT